MNKIVLKSEDLRNEASHRGRIAGTPEISDGFLVFSGSDGLFLPENPLPPWKAFRLSLKLFPASGGAFEQRFLHWGEVHGPRILLETRSTNGRWCLDFYVECSDGSQLVLLDLNRMHPEDRWYSVQADVTKNQVAVYLNGEPENSADFSYIPVTGGASSYGVRQNEVSWFTGRVGDIEVRNIEGV